MGEGSPHHHHLGLGLPFALLHPLPLYLLHCSHACTVYHKTHSLLYTPVTTGEGLSLYLSLSTLTLYTIHIHTPYTPLSLPFDFSTFPHMHFLWRDTFLSLFTHGAHTHSLELPLSSLPLPVCAYLHTHLHTSLYMDTLSLSYMFGATSSSSLPFHLSPSFLDFTVELLSLYTYHHTIPLYYIYFLPFACGTTATLSFSLSLLCFHMDFWGVLVIYHTHDFHYPFYTDTHYHFTHTCL